MLSTAFMAVATASVTAFDVIVAPEIASISAIFMFLSLPMNEERKLSPFSELLAATAPRPEVSEWLMMEMPLQVYFEPLSFTPTTMVIMPWAPEKVVCTTYPSPPSAFSMMSTVPNCDLSNSTSSYSAAGRTAEYAAKVVVAQTMMQQEPRPAFDLEKVRRRAATLADSYQIRAYIKQVGRENLCETLSRRPTPNLVEQLVGPRNRYALKDETRRALQELGRGMKTEGRSKEWKALQQALLSDAGNSVALFDKAEAYLKGKKSVRMTQEGRDSFDLAMKAIALAARDGDAMAEQRAKMLMDRVNEVRGATPGSKDYVSMEKYLGSEAAQAEAPAVGTQARQAQHPAEV